MRDSDYDPDYLDPQVEAEAVEAERARMDYLAAREALKRIHHSMDRDTVWAIQDRFVAAETALRVWMDHRRMGATNARILREIAAEQATRQGAA